jgi:SAM-dependent methyltransferase
VPLAACPSCGGHTFRDLPFEYEYRGATFPGGECAQCGLRGLTVQPAPAEFAVMYARGYFEGGDARCGHVGDYFAERPALLADGARLAGWFESLRGGRPGRLLEVGCAAGATLEAAAARGWTVFGVEYSADAAAEARAHGVPVFVGGLAEGRVPDMAYDVVFMGDVLEHVPDPAATLREVHRVLAPGGALALRGPMATHSLARRLGITFMKGRKLKLAEPPYHLWEFEPATLQALTRDAGLRVESFRQSKTPPSFAKRRGAQALAVAALDAGNAAWTALTGTLGDRCTMVARRPTLDQARA